jgi:hypothetical protein
MKIPIFINVFIFFSSRMQDWYILQMAYTDGNPMYCLISARSTNAKSIAAVIFEVVRIRTLGYLK